MVYNFSHSQYYSMSQFFRLSVTNTSFSFISIIYLCCLCVFWVVQFPYLLNFCISTILILMVLLWDLRTYAWEWKFWATQGTCSYLRLVETTLFFSFCTLTMWTSVLWIYCFVFFIGWLCVGHFANTSPKHGAKMLTSVPECKKVMMNFSEDRCAKEVSFRHERWVWC